MTQTNDKLVDTRASAGVVEEVAAWLNKKGSKWIDSGTSPVLPPFGPSAIIYMARKLRAALGQGTIPYPAAGEIRDTLAVVADQMIRIADEWERLEIGNLVEPAQTMRGWAYAIKQEQPTTEPEGGELLLCVHGRPGGAMCPHCLGVSSTTAGRSAEVPDMVVRCACGDELGYEHDAGALSVEPCSTCIAAGIQEGRADALATEDEYARWRTERRYAEVAEVAEVEQTLRYWARRSNTELRVNVNPLRAMLLAIADKLAGSAPAEPSLCKICGIAPVRLTCMCEACEAKLLESNRRAEPSPDAGELADGSGGVISWIKSAAAVLAVFRRRNPDWQALKDLCDDAPGIMMASKLRRLQPGQAKAARVWVRHKKGMEWGEDSGIESVHTSSPGGGVCSGPYEIHGAAEGECEGCKTRDRYLDDYSADLDAERQAHEETRKQVAELEARLATDGTA